MCAGLSEVTMGTFKECRVQSAGGVYTSAAGTADRDILIATVGQSRDRRSPVGSAFPIKLDRLEIANVIDKCIHFGTREVPAH